MKINTEMTLLFSRPEMTLVLAGRNRRGCSMVVLHQGGRGRPDPRCKSTFFYPIFLEEWSTKLNQNPTFTRKQSFGSFLKDSKRPFFAESHKSLRPLDQEKRPVGPICCKHSWSFLSDWCTQCVCVLQCEYYYMNTSCNKFCREKTSLGQKSNYFNLFCLQYIESIVPIAKKLQLPISNWYQLRCLWLEFNTCINCRKRSQSGQTAALRY